MNFGCGTLLVLLILVVAAGNLIPHGGDVPVKKKEVPESMSARARDGARMNQVPSGKGEAGVPGAKAPVEPDDPVRSLKEAFGGLGSLLAQLPAQFEAYRQILPNSFQMPDMAGALNNETLSRIKGEVQGFASKASALSPPGLVQGGESGKGTVPDLAGSRAEVPEARPGRHAVYNNPWAQSVDQVEHYLRDHVHDPSSLEFLRWGKVEVSPSSGYQVRCDYRTKNVLGKITEQSQLFVLDQEGRVVDVRD